jgi:insulysin
MIPLEASRPIVFQPPRLNVSGNAIVALVSLGPKANISRISTEILSKLFKEPFYSELRTVQQTGYLVHSGSLMAGNSELFLQIAIQSNTHDPRDLLARVELFIETFLRTLTETAGEKERFASLKASVAEKLKQPYENMQGKLRYQMQLAFDEDADFTMIRDRLALLETYEFEDLVKFAQQQLGKGNKKRIAVLCTGSDVENVANSYGVEEVDKYRAQKIKAKL